MSMNTGNVRWARSALVGKFALCCALGALATTEIGLAGETATGPASHLMALGAAIGPVSGETAAPSSSGTPGISGSPASSPGNPQSTGTLPAAGVPGGTPIQPVQNRPVGSHANFINQMDIGNPTPGVGSPENSGVTGPVPGQGQVPPQGLPPEQGTPAEQGSPPSQGLAPTQGPSPH